VRAPDAAAALTMHTPTLVAPVRV